MTCFVVQGTQDNAEVKPPSVRQRKADVAFAPKGPLSFELGAHVGGASVCAMLQKAPVPGPRAYTKHK